MGVRTSSLIGAALTVLIACHTGQQPATVDEGYIPSTPDSVALAIQALNERIVADPGRAALYRQRSQLYVSMDSLRQGVRDMERAVALDSTDVVHHLMLGDLYYRTTAVDKAQAQFEKASALDPDDTQALLKRAEIKLVLRKYKESLDLVNEALRKDPVVARGYFLKGWIHMETGDTNLALSSFRTAVEQDAQDYSAYILLGKLSAARHDPLAEQYYNTALLLRPNSVEAWYNKGMYYQENGLDSLALDAYRHVAAIDSLNALAWYNSGWVRMEHLNDLPGAKRDFSRAIALEPAYFDAWYNRGVAMERANELDSAAANYQVTLSIAPTHALAAEALDRLAAKGVRIKMRERQKK